MKKGNTSSILERIEWVGGKLQLCSKYGKPRERCFHVEYVKKSKAEKCAEPKSIVQEKIQIAK